jgi:hypothetical protein
MVKPTREQKVNSLKQISNVIKKVLKDFEPSKINSEQFTNKIIRIDEIPSYLILLLFKSIDFIALNKFGISRFAFTIRYKGVDLMIRDYRSYRCEIYSIQNDQHIITTCKEVQSKITKGVDILDECLSIELGEIAKQGGFFIQNSYTLLGRFFYTLSQEIKDNESAFKSLSFTDQIDYLWKLEQKSFSLLVTFFSITDFLFLIFYIMDEKVQSSEDIKKFTRLKWNQKFMAALDINAKEIKPFYEKLLKFRNKYRNPLSHGMVGEDSLLIPFPYIGLMPISYKNNLRGYLSYGLDSNATKDIIKTTEGFLDLLERIEPYCFYMMFLSKALPIPVKKEALLRLKSEMTDIESFSEYLESIADSQDRMDNLED